MKTMQLLFKVLQQYIRQFVHIFHRHISNSSKNHLFYKYTVPTKRLGTPPNFQCILMALRVLLKRQ